MIPTAEKRINNLFMQAVGTDRPVSVGGSMTTDFLERSAQLAADYRTVQKELSEVSTLIHELRKRIDAREG